MSLENESHHQPPICSNFFLKKAINYNLINLFLKQLTNMMLCKYFLT